MQFGITSTEIRTVAEFLSQRSLVDESPKYRDGYQQAVKDMEELLSEKVMQNMKVVAEELDRINAMQSTGLFDVNGMEIFEGDIVKLCFEEDGLFEICLDTVGGFYTKSVLTGKIQFLEVSDFDELETAKEVFNEYVEIVGNIYENPEFLEEE